MERIIDKLIVLACCAPTFALTGTDSMSVGAMLVAAACSFSSEMPTGRAKLLPPAFYCAFACVVPAGAAFAASAAYDLARKTPALALAAAAPIAAALWTEALPSAAAACSLLPCGVAAALSWRTGKTLSAQQRNLTLADDLRERELALKEKNRELLDAQDYEVRLATLSERARIAREIHDNVGHLLTRATVQTEAIRVMHAGEPVESEVAGVAETLHETLGEIRSSVHDLRDDSCDLSVQIRAIAERACRGTAVEPTMHIEAEKASEPVASCLAAVAREAISNTLRHAHATRMRVELIEHPGLWRLTVSDDGTPSPADTKPNSGMGLASMEERIRSLGGTFRAGPGRQGGWIVFASVPKEQIGGRHEGHRMRR